MILIISESNDLTTDLVIDWLYSSNFNNLVRINENDKITLEKIDLNNGDIVITKNNEIEINLKKIKFFWYRRGNLNNFFDKHFPINSNSINRQAQKFMNYEWLMCRNYIFEYLNKKPSLGNYFKSATNKLINLDIAKKVGLKIPSTLISSSSVELNKFSSKFNVITKPIGEGFPIYDQDGYYQMFTSEVKKGSFAYENVFPTLLQQKIEKHFELRVFILRNKLYSMAIFSQNNEQSVNDYRKLDQNLFNRMIPYMLPPKIENRLLNFMNEVGLDTGSIDLIKTYSNDYYFLEVNPAGNIEMVSDTCNYNIEKNIAKLIIEEIDNV